MKKHPFSERTFCVILFSMLANHQVKHQATQKVGCQPSDCRWPLILPQVLWVSMHCCSHFDNPARNPEGHMHEAVINTACINVVFS